MGDEIIDATSGNPDTLLSLTEAEAQTLRLLTRRWALEIITLLAQGPARYKDLRQSIPRLHDRMLSERLDNLIEEGLVVRIQSADKPIVVTYSLATSEAPGLTAIAKAVCSYVEDRLERVDANKTVG